MKLYGITTCVGERYASFLAGSLERWSKICDSVFVLLDPKERDSRRLLPKFSNVARIETDAFHCAIGELTVAFNKPAALNVAVSMLMRQSEPDWLACFDCDIVPPWSLRETIYERARRMYINGAFRYSVTGQRIDKAPLFVKGYFQLWHAHDPRVADLTPFDISSGHAGGYDTIFGRRWTKEFHNDLGVPLLHQGQPSRYWFGPNTTHEQMDEALRDADLARGGRH